LKTKANVVVYEVVSVIAL